MLYLSANQEEKMIKKVLFILLGILMAGSATLYAQRPQRITVGSVSFYLAPDYKEKSRMPRSDGSESCMIIPKNSKDNTRLILRINPEALRNVNGLTDEEIKQILFRYVNEHVSVFANKKKSGYTIDQKYQVRYNRNADGSYFPHCYSYLNWRESDGKHYLSYTEAALVNRTIVCGTAIARDKGELKALTEIYSDVVGAANE